MVARLLIRWSGIIVLLLALAVGAIRAQPYHDAELKNLLKGACAPPCWQQIYPGATTGEEALAIMKRFNLARDVGIHFDRRTGQIFWRWSADTAAYLNHDSPHLPYIWLRDDVVSHIFLPDFQTFADAVLGLGRPENIHIFTDTTSRSGYAIYAAAYPGDVYISSVLLCEARLLDLWNAPANVFIGGAPEYIGTQSREYKLSELHGWLPEKLCTYRR